MKTKRTFILTKRNKQLSLLGNNEEDGIGEFNTHLTLTEDKQGINSRTNLSKRMTEHRLGMMIK